MKQTLTMNLAGQVYHIDEDAYVRLQAYLTRVEAVLKEDAKEVMQDIEARMAELFSEAFAAEHIEIVTIQMVDTAIAHLGEPEQISIDGDEANAQAEASADTNTATEQAQLVMNDVRKRKLYLDTDHAVVSGVCAGLSQYTGMDVTLVRILFVLCTLLWGTALILYGLLWMIIPAATTAAQRLEMRGIEPTAENIRREVSERQESPVAPKNSGCLAFLIKLCLGFVLVCILLPIMVAIIAVLFSLTAAVSVIPVGTTLLGTGIHAAGIAMIVSIICFVALPIVALIGWLCIRQRPYKERKVWPWVVLLTMWLLSLVGICGSGLLLSNAAQEVMYHLDDEQVQELVRDALEKAREHMDENTWQMVYEAIQNDQLDSLLSNDPTYQSIAPIDIDTTDPMGEEVMILEE